MVITGANSGIGRETAVGLARLGAEVTIAVRNPTKGAEALADIRRRSGSDLVSQAQLDLADLDSVRRCAGELLDRLERIDVLVNNAGIIADERRETRQGFEEMFGVNHLGHFLLVHRILPLVLRAAPARILVVASNAHKRAKRGIDFEDLQNTRKFVPFDVYGQSKLANIWFARELARKLRGTGVVVHSLHPGVVATEFAGADDARGLAHLAFTLGRPFLKTPAEGAATTVFLATSDSAMHSTGLYYSDCVPVRPNRYGEDDVAAARLWTVSESLLGLPPLVVPST